MNNRQTQVKPETSCMIYETFKYTTLAFLLGIVAIHHLKIRTVRNNWILKSLKFIHFSKPSFLMVTDFSQIVNTCFVQSNWKIIVGVGKNKQSTVHTYTIYILYIRVLVCVCNAFEEKKLSEIICL